MRFDARLLRRRGRCLKADRAVLILDRQTERRGRRGPPHAGRRRHDMPTYVSLLRFTDQGIRNIKESPTRLDAAKKAFQAQGAELKQFFLMMGQYDILLVAEAPNDEAVGKVALALGSLGNVRTESYRVFTEAEYRKMIASLP
jgi:uncharacterized protein with GYD domain